MNVDFQRFDCTEFHSFFPLPESTRHTLLPDKMGLHFFKLKKRPNEINEKGALLLWLPLFRGETEEELVL